MYCLVVTDDYSRFTWVFFLATKDETSGILESFITRIENLADHKVKAEAVNTTCYVQNRVLVVKPHNNTPYELFLGRTPTLSFVRPSGCPVTILNTIGNLGKFDGKADEGFFVRYSLNSKAFRVFKSRLRIVEENLHIRFSESTSNVIGSGPDWLFDIDALTRTMNYEPIVADPKSSNDDGSKPSSDNGKKVDKDPRKVNECNDQEKEDNVNSTNNVNTVSLTINTAGTNGVNFWSIAMAKAINGEAQLHAKVDGKKIIFIESSVRKDLRLVPQPSGPTQSVVDEAVHKELGDRLVRATTTASSLEAEQDNEAVHKELGDRLVRATTTASSLEAEQDSGGLKCQETMRDTIAQTRFESVSKHSNNLLLARESMGEDASKQERRIDAIDANEYITLGNDADNEMFDMNTLVGDEVFVARQIENVVDKVVDAAQVSTAATTVIITTKEITLAQALEALKLQTQAKGFVF
nr:ribonuclease H-like domain-containing protein [Tanacetum cinerariifolium]